MGILNQASDGLPSVLFALVRTLRHFGPMPKADLLALCAPPSLQDHTARFSEEDKGGKTLRRWTQLGLFLESGDRIELHPEVDGLPNGGLAEVRGLAPLLRRLALNPANNRELNDHGDEENESAADLILGLSWVLAQDIYSLPGGPHGDVTPLEQRQFASEPYAFRNSDRWNGFRAWAPLLGFGWTEGARGRRVLVIDPTPAVRDAIPAVLDGVGELPVEEFLQRLADALPVLDGGEYRRQVEARLVSPAWRATRPSEISVSLSTALKRLDTAGTIRLQSRADAPKRTLLGRGYRNLEQISHVTRGDQGHA